MKHAPAKFKSSHTDWPQVKTPLGSQLRLSTCSPETIYFENISVDAQFPNRRATEANQTAFDLGVITRSSITWDDVAVHFNFNSTGMFLVNKWHGQLLNHHHHQFILFLRYMYNIYVDRVKHTKFMIQRWYTSFAVVHGRWFPPK